MSEAPNPSNRWSTPTLDGNASMPRGPGDAPTVAAGAQDGAPGGAVAVARYPDYADAQRAVDRLADSRFPVEQTAIVGTDLTLVENVLGRLTTGGPHWPAPVRAPGSASSSACSSASSPSGTGSPSSWRVW